MSKNAYPETQPSLNPEITPNFRSQASQIFDSLKAKAQRVSRQTAIRAAVVSTHLVVAVGILTAPYLARAQEIPPSDVPTQPSGDQPTDQPVTIEGSEQTTSDGSTETSPSPEPVKQWQLFAESYPGKIENWSSDYSRPGQPVSREFIPNIPNDKFWAIEAHLWTDNTKKDQAYFVEIPGGLGLVNGNKEVDINYKKGDNRWYLVYGSHGQQPTITPLELYGQEISTRIEFGDGSGITYKATDGQIKEQKFNNFNISSAEGTSKIGGWVNRNSTLDFKAIKVFISDKPTP